MVPDETVAELATLLFRFPLALRGHAERVV